MKSSCTCPAPLQIRGGGIIPIPVLPWLRPLSKTNVGAKSVRSVGQTAFLNLKSPVRTNRSKTNRAAPSGFFDQQSCMNVARLVQLNGSASTRAIAASVSVPVRRTSRTSVKNGVHSSTLATLANKCTIFAVKTSRGLARIIALNVGASTRIAGEHWRIASFIAG